MKMIKQILILCITIWLVALPTKTFGEGYYAFGIGNGGESDATSLTLEFDKIRKNRLIGFGLSITFSADDIPSDILDYPCPHSDYTDLGKRQKENGFALFAKYGKALCQGKDLYVFATGGLYFTEEIHLVRSKITGWYYTQSADDKFRAMFGAGLNYVLRNGKNFISFEYDNIRGVTASVGIRFL